jgi:amino acid adenylation domain-containing protein/non-ribosomal peptide synthase protein (TIGR01720 family)
MGSPAGPVVGFPLSPQQRRVWALQQAGARPYRAQAVLRIDGPLDNERLEAAFRAVASRHEILRTMFRAGPSHGAVQVIGAQPQIHLDRHDLRGLTEDAQAERLEALLREQGDAPCDLSRLPLARADLAQLSPERHRLLVSWPALCGDRRSLEILLEELGRGYAGVPPPAGSADGEPLQYADIAAWADELLVAPEGEAAREFWRQQAARFVPGVPLPFVSPALPGSTFEPLSHEVAIDTDDVRRLDALAQRLGTAGEQVLLACFQVQLCRLAGVPVTVAAAFDGRRHAGLGGALGLLAGYLPLHYEPALWLSFRDAVARLDAAAHQARDRQELFTWDRFWAATTEAPDPRAFLPFGFDFAALPDDVSVEGMHFGLARTRVCQERFVLRLSCARSARALTAELVYDRQALSAPDVERLADGFRALLHGALAAPDSRVGDLDVMGEAERRRVVVEFNDTARDYPRDTCIHELIEEQARLHPQAPAAVFEGRELSYTDLDARANRLAHRLQRLGVGPEVLVALCFERSLEMVVAILGVLKAGGAYVPLDPKYPEDRLRFMLEETDAPVLLTQSHLTEALPTHRARVLCLDIPSPEDVDAPASKPASAVAPSNLAYVIYTSGSTGRPKGVMISHQGLVMSTTARFPFFDADVERFLLLSPLPFDSSVVGIYWTLCRGGTLVLVRDERQQDVARLAETIASERVSHLLTLPSFWGLVLEHAQPEQLAGLKTVIVAGEPCPKRLVDQHRGRLPATALINEYGATENTVWCSGYDCRALTLLVAPLGRPIANARLYVLDAGARPAPIGVAGELYSGGEALARGYWKRPDLTAERFLPDPFAGRPGARLYRSGDMTRLLPDGNVEFLGRMDHQVKIRGFRIELPEIEAALAAHPSIAEAVVAAREDAGKGKRLVAYVVTEPGAGVAAKELRAFLKERLPDFMVPAAFAFLDALPRMPNGKVDRGALPAPDAGAPSADETRVPARNAIEELLAEVWSKVLGVAEVGVHDNFFDLGGDSLLSIQVVARANQKGLGLTPRQLFQHQTLAELAASVGTTQVRAADQGSVTGALPLTPVQHWFFELGLPVPQHWNMPLLLEARRRVDPAHVAEVLSALVRHHDALRLRFERAGNAWRQAIVPPDATVPLERIDLSSVPDARVADAVEAAAGERQRGLDLARGPLLRAAWFDLGPERPSRLLLVIHHLAVDGLSWRILLEDLEAGLGQRGQGQPIRLPLKTTSYREWAERLREDAASGAWARQLPHWLSLERARAWRLPLDRPDGVNSEASARKVSSGLTTEETQALLQKVPRAYRTQINEVLLAALVEALAPWTGRRSLLLNLEGHGREDVLEGVDLSRTVGWFTTDFPVALDLEGRRGPGESLAAVKDQLRSIPNQGIGYGVLRYLGADPTTAQALARLPRPEVAFNYMGQFDQTLDDASPFRLARESCGPSQAPEGPRPFPLEIYGMVSEGRFTLDWEYSANVFARSTVESLARGYERALRELIDHCLSQGAGAYSATDVVDYKWSQGDLDEIAAAIRRSQEE